jgi:hypothetical protein
VANTHTSLAVRNYFTAVIDGVVVVVRTGEELEGGGQAPAVGGDVARRAEEHRPVGLV